MRPVTATLLLSLCVTISSAQTRDLPLDLHLRESRVLPGCDLTTMTPNRPRLALALSGGGARGFSHIGVLKVLESRGIPVDAIAGTSIGAIVGGLYAAGYTAAEIESLAVAIQWDEIISSDPSREQLFVNQKDERSTHLLQLRFKGSRLVMSSGYSTGHHLSALLRRLILNTPYQYTTDFRDLPISFCAVTSDLVSGRSVRLTSGSLTDAMRASMAIPLLFTPLRKDSMLLVDGGLIQNLPVSDARALGADVVMCVDASSRLRPADDLDAPWKIADQVTSIMQQEKLESQLRAADIVVSPELHGVTNTDFQRVSEIIAAGETAAQSVMSGLQALLAEQDSSDLAGHRVDSLRFLGFERTDPEPFLKALLPFTAGDTLSLDRLIWAAENLNQTGRYDRIGAALDTVSGTLTVTVHEHPVIHAVSFSGNSVLPDSAILSCITISTGSVLEIQRLKQSAAAITHAYKDADCGLARIDSVWVDRGTLTIRIDEGIIRHIGVEGNRRSRPFVILREVRQKKGDVFRTSEALQSIENIYSSGFFDEAGMVFPSSENSHTLTLKVHERENSIARVGAHYTLERRGSGFISLIRDNILGFGAQGSLTGIAGQRDLYAGARLWSNRFLYSYLAYDATLSLSRSEFLYYRDLKESGEYAYYNREARLTVLLQMLRLGSLSAELAWQSLDIHPISGSGLPDEYNNIINFTIRSEVDTRDRYPFPREGKHHLLQYETAGSWLGSETAYSIIYSFLDHYIPLTSRYTLRPRVRWGTADITTPFAKQFQLGGLDSFLGLPENALIGRRMIGLNVGLQARLPRLFSIRPHLTIRYDLAGIWPSYSQISLKDFHHGAGVILAANSPIGPVRLGIGWADHGQKQLYFSAGHEF
ncbi:patatin-like phospholipase family protein [bacterium]|nr:patatin-like phospholipase family protein [bacterium]